MKSIQVPPHDRGGHRPICIVHSLNHLCSLLVIPLLLLIASTCRTPTLSERVGTLEPLLTEPASASVERTTRDDRSRQGAAVSVIELRFPTHSPLSEVGNYYNDILISRYHYSQTLHISTPAAIRLEYASPDTYIYITVDAQSIQPPPDDPQRSASTLHLVISYLKSAP